MTTLLIWTRPELEADLSRTPLWRDELERYVTAKRDDARALLFATEPHVIVVDRDLLGADDFMASLRAQPLPHPVSIVALTRDPSAALDVDAVLALPAGPEWDDRLVGVLQAPTRAQERFDVHFDVETLPQQGAGPQRGLVRNLSAGGILIECASLRIRPGDDVRLSLPLPGLQSPVRGRARVVRQPVEEHLGLRFEAFSGDGDVRVREFLAALAGQARP